MFLAAVTIWCLCQRGKSSRGKSQLLVIYGISDCVFLTGSFTNYKYEKAVKRGLRTHWLHKLKLLPLLHLLDLEDVLKGGVIKNLSVFVHLWVSLQERTPTTQTILLLKRGRNLLWLCENLERVYLEQLGFLLSGGDAEVFFLQRVIPFCLLIKLLLSLLMKALKQRGTSETKTHSCRRQKEHLKEE